MLSGAHRAVDLQVPQPGHDPVHALGEVAAVGAERQPERRGRPLLGGGRSHIGPLHGPPQLVVARVLAQGLHGRAHQRLQRRRARLLGPGAVTDQAGPQQRVADQQVPSAQVSQGLSDGLVELRLGEHQQGRLDRWRGRRDVLGEGALGPELQ